MGLYKIIEKRNIKIGVWEIKESLEELLQLSENKTVPQYTHEKRKKEFLIIQLLLNNLCLKNTIRYNKFGAPELNNSQYLSISHSKKYAVVLLANKKVGVDIEEITNKALKLSTKFIARDLLKNLSKEEATLIWCAKEAVYKWHQKGNINLKKDITIKEVNAKEKGMLTILFKKEELLLNYEKVNNHYLVYVCK